MATPPSEMFRPCPACGSADERDHVVTYGRPYEVVECLNCALRFVNEPAPPTTVGDYPIVHFQETSDLRQRRARSDVAQLLQFVEGANPLGRGADGALRMLDIGCGIGHVMLEARARGVEVRGTEINRRASAFVREQYNMDVLDASAEGRIDFPNDFFDIVTLFGVIEHLVEPRTAILECHRVLKPGGTICLKTPSEDGMIRFVGRALYRYSGGVISFHVPSLFFLGGGHNLCFSQRSMTNLLTGTGFEPQAFMGSTYGFGVLRQRFGVSPRDLARLVGTAALYGLGMLTRRPNHMTVFAVKTDGSAERH